VVTVAEVWDLLAAEGRSERGWHTRRLHTGSACDIRSAVRAPDRGIAVLFEVSAKSIPPGADLPNCVGFQLVPETIEPGPNGRIRLCLVIKDARYRDVFGTLGDDVATVVAGAATEAFGVKLLLGRLHTWGRFVSRFGPDRLSEEQQVGLFAELHFLVSEVVPVVTAAAAVRAWRGPFMEAHDFRFRAVAIEVKASSFKDAKTFQVSNLDQLDAGTLDALLVHHVTVDADASIGDTLPEIVARTTASLAVSDPAAASDLGASLLEVGYLDAHADFYRRKFRVGETRWLKITETFPRLTRATVPPGVGAASYSVTLVSCIPYMVDASAARKIMQERF